MVLHLVLLLLHPPIRTAMPVAGELNKYRFVGVDAHRTVLCYECQSFTDTSAPSIAIFYFFSSPLRLFHPPREWPTPTTPASRFGGGSTPAYDGAHHQHRPGSGRHDDYGNYEAARGIGGHAFAGQVT
jgi:hypothetical protein